VTFPLFGRVSRTLPETCCFFSRCPRVAGRGWPGHRMAGRTGDQFHRWGNTPLAAPS